MKIRLRVGSFFCFVFLIFVSIGCQSSTSSEFTDSMAVRIDGPDVLVKKTKGTWTAELNSQIDGEASYVWYKSYDGSDFGKPICYSKSYSSSESNIWLKAVVSSGTSEGSAIMYVDFEFGPIMEP
ncbi:hypothetical protein K1X84_15290 [bacterium]|nr:hypothetical protein [bacterium]